MAFSRPLKNFLGVSMLSTLRSGITSAISRRAVPTAPRVDEESRAALLERL
jgi:hypothetical protein